MRKLVFTILLVIACVTSASALTVSGNVTSSATFTNLNSAACVWTDNEYTRLEIWAKDLNSSSLINPTSIEGLFNNRTIIPLRIEFTGGRQTNKPTTPIVVRPFTYPGLDISITSVTVFANNYTHTNSGQAYPYMRSDGNILAENATFNFQIPTRYNLLHDTVTQMTNSTGWLGYTITCDARWQMMYRDATCSVGSIESLSFLPAQGPLR